MTIDKNITLTSADLRINVAMLGAELSSMIYRGEELLWQGDPKVLGAARAELISHRRSIKGRYFACRVRAPQIDKA